MPEPIKIPPRDPAGELARRLDQVERAIELTVSWQYQLRARVDGVRDEVSPDRLSPLEARVAQLEHEVETLRHVLQDISQLLVAQGLLGPDDPPGGAPSR